jgi:colicin import membrane protein
MTAYVNETPNEKALSGALALVMHLLFFALLVVGVSWQKREAPPMVAELWSELPAPKVAPPPPPKVEPKPVPKAQPKPPPPKVEPKPAPKPDLKADIALREKKEKERKAKEQELAEKKKRAEQKRLEEQAQLEKLKAQQEKERAEQLAREQDEALRKIAQSKAAEQARLVDEYKRRIADKIRSRITEPPGLKGNPEVEFDVVVLPGGDVLDVKIRKASGQAAWDAAVERGIRSAQPLPLPPPESGLMREFRELNLKFRPKE